jgi:mRNA interferase RelE/StbE
VRIHVTDFAVQLTKPAIRDIRSLPESIQPDIIEGIKSLQQDPIPSPPLKKKLRGFGYPVYRMRIADYRLLYRIDEGTVTIMRVIDRKDLERTIGRLRR